MCPWSMYYCCSACLDCINCSETFACLPALCCWRWIVWCMHVSCFDCDVHSCFGLWSALSQSSWSCMLPMPIIIIMAVACSRHVLLIRCCFFSGMSTNRNGRSVTGCFRSFFALVVRSRFTALRARTVLAWNGVWLTTLRPERSASIHGTWWDMQSKSRVSVFSSKSRQIWTNFQI